MGPNASRVRRRASPGIELWARACTPVRGWGRSGRGPVTLGYREAQDGAAAAILAARESPVISSCARLDWEVQFMARRFGGPARLAPRPSAGDPKTLWLVDGAGHPRARRQRPAEYAGRVAEFFAEAFAGEPDECA